MIKSLLLGAAIYTALGAAASAQDAERNYLPKNGQELVALLDGCEDASCISYLSGVIDGISAYAYLTGQKSPICASPEVSSDEIRNAVISVTRQTDFFKENFPPAAILAAFSRNWPCPSDDPSSTIASDPAPPTPALTTYNDLVQIDLEHFLEFSSRDAFAHKLGNPDAPVEKTLHVFLDPNSDGYQAIVTELDELAKADWRIVIYPISRIAPESKGFSAIQFAVRDTVASEALYRLTNEKIKDIGIAMQVAQAEGLALNTILDSLASSAPYDTIEENNRSFEAFGGDNGPAWILGDRIGTGRFDAEEIARIQQTMMTADVVEEGEN